MRRVARQNSSNIANKWAWFVPNAAGNRIIGSRTRRVTSAKNPPIGIILCKEKSNTIVEFAFRDTSKPMGVATYHTARELPPEYKGILPDVEKLKELM